MTRRFMVVLAGLVAVLFASMSASAVAEVSHPFLSSFDGSGTPAGSLGQTGGVAVDRVTGDVYVADIANNVVDKFSAEGGYLCQITGSSVPSLSECNGVGGSATGAGSFSFGVRAALAVDNSTSPGDPSAGDLYVIDAGHGAVDKFSSSGAFLGEVASSLSERAGVGVDGSGNVWVYGVSAVSESTSTVSEFDSSGNPVFRFHPGGPIFTGHVFAVDSNGNSYPSPAEVEKYDSAGHSLGLVDTCVFCATDVATDLSTDDVYVDNQSYVAEYDSAANPLVQFGSPQLASGGVGGIAVNPLTGEVYVANAADKKVYVFGPAPGPRVLPEAATSVQTTSATLNAEVNPEGSDTTYRFEYGTGLSYGQSAPLSPVDIGSGSGAVAANAVLGGLEGGTTYHYRVVASNANGTVHSADRTFRTLPVPVIDGVSAVNLSASSVDLTARIDPEGLDTTYRFEVGTSTAYGTSLPVPDADIGAGSGDVAVSQHVVGLSANTLYHWRVLARNSNGTTTGSDHTFIYATTGNGLPDDRAYEMVTPPQKNAAVIGDVVFGNPPDFSEDGSRLILSSIQCFADAGSCTGNRGPVGSSYEFARTGSGWATTPLAPPATQFEVSSSRMLGADAGSGLFSIPASPGGGDDWYVRRPDGSFVDIGPGTPPSGSGTGALGVHTVGATVDFSRVVWSTPVSSWPFDATTAGDSVYEYSGTGNSAPVLVGVSGWRGSTDLISACETRLGGLSVQGGKYNFLSADGRTVFFTAAGCASGSGANAGVPVPADALYARIDESRTVAISARAPESQCDSVCQGSPAGDANFQGASSDGSRAFFTSTQQLTDSASEDSHSGDTAKGAGCPQTTGVNGCNLYEYDFNGSGGHDLVAVSAGDSSGLGPQVQGVMAVSSDGSHVYFIARGVLSGAANSEGQTARAGAYNLYVFERDASYPEGRIAFIAALSGENLGFIDSDSHQWMEGGLANVTPDGRFLVFTSTARLTVDDTSASGAAQVFRYDALSGQLVRISIGENGFNDNGNAGVGSAGIAAAFPFYDHAGPARPDPTMSHDGAYVFFESPVGLTPGALNDVELGFNSNTGKLEYAMNVYEYHAGHVYLISDGRDTAKFRAQSAVKLLGSDATGANVFFRTADQLVAQDIDTQMDYYDARVCTASDPCVTPPPAPAPVCQGEACHGTPSASPPGVAGATVAFSGLGNLLSQPAPAAKPKRKAKHRPKTKRRRKAKHRARQGRVGQHGSHGHTRVGGK